MKLDSSIAAVVTGGASGLGAATARALAAKGVKVAIFDLQEEKGKAIAEIPNVPTAAAIANAIYDAVGVRLYGLPITAEKIYAALNGK